MHPFPQHCHRFNMRLHPTPNYFNEDITLNIPSKSFFCHRWWNSGHKDSGNFFGWCSHLLLYNESMLRISCKITNPQHHYISDKKTSNELD